MKTLILFSSSEIGGAEQSLSRLASVGNNKEFILGSLSGEGILLKNNILQKVGVQKFGYQKVSFFNLVLSCFKSLKFAKEQNIMNIYICGFKACTIIRIFSLFMKTPKIFHAIRWNPISNNFDDKIFRLLERFFIFQTKAWICNSYSAKKTLIKYCGVPKNKIFSIHNGINIPNIKKDSSKKENVILTLSNFAERKGIIEYLSVIEIVVKTYKNIKFILAGRDDMKGLVQKEIKKRKLENFITTPGFVQNTESLLKTSRIMVLPSILPEGCPTSILEGMSWGLPIICYDISGIEELVIKNKTGYIASLNNKKEMADMIIKLLRNPNILKKFGTNGNKIVSQNFTLNGMLRKHRNIFNSFN